MKKIILSILAAVLSLISLQSFKKKSKSITYYWFLINSGDSQPVGTTSDFFNYEVAFLSVATTVTPTISPCDATNSYQCIVGYTSTRIQTSGESYILRTVGGPLRPQEVPNGAANSQYVRSAK